MKTQTLLEPVKKYYFSISIPDSISAADYNREVRNWLGGNCECTWETRVNDDKDKFWVVGVYFDLNSSEEDMMAFKLRWM